MLAYGMMFAALLGSPRDPATIPPAERIAYVNKLTDRLSGINAYRDYARAQDSYVAVYELSMDAPTEAARKACDHVDRQLSAFALAERWSSDETHVIREWLKANKPTLESLKKATKRKRYFHPLDPHGGRLHAVVVDSTGVELMQFSKLCAIAANNHALRGEWKQAYEWNLRMHIIADHICQQPFVIQHLVSMGIERIACQQSLHFFQRQFAKNATAFLQGMSVRDDLRCPAALTDEAEKLWSRDYIEAWHEWAQDPQKHPDLAETAETWLAGNDLLEEESGFFGDSPFVSVEALREALRASSVEKEWHVSLRADALVSKWCALPFHKAWKEAGEFEREYCDVILEAPSLGAFGCGALASSQPRLLRTETAAHRSAVACIVAILEFRNDESRLPKRLDELVPRFLNTAPIDVYSGRPFVYRVNKDGNGFVLYSVGGDQDDDGGKHTDDTRGDGDRVFWPPPVVTVDNG